MDPQKQPIHIPYPTAPFIQPQQPTQQYIVISIERKPGCKWGISLSFFRSKYLIVGAADQSTLSRWISGFYSCPCPVDNNSKNNYHETNSNCANNPCIFWQKPCSINVISFIKYLFSISPTSSLSSSTATLLPGDCILAINYRPVTTFSSLEEITSMFTKSHKTCLLVLRNPLAVQRAALILQTLPTHQHQITFSNQVSTEAFQCYEALEYHQQQQHQYQTYPLHPIGPVPRPSPYFPSTTTTPIIRMTTVSPVQSRRLLPVVTPINPPPSGRQTQLLPGLKGGDSNPKPPQLVSSEQTFTTTPTKITAVNKIFNNPATIKTPICEPLKRNSIQQHRIDVIAEKKKAVARRFCNPLFLKPNGDYLEYFDNDQNSSHHIKHCVEFYGPEEKDDKTKGYKLNWSVLNDWQILRDSSEETNQVQEPNSTPFKSASCAESSSALVVPSSASPSSLPPTSSLPCGNLRIVSTGNKTNLDPSQSSPAQTPTSNVARSLSFHNPQNPLHDPNLPNPDQIQSNNSTYHRRQQQNPRRVVVDFVETCPECIGPDDGSRSKLFLREINANQFQSWLSKRKQEWKERYNVYPFRKTKNSENDIVCSGEGNITVATDFWTGQGFSNFQDWLSQRKQDWRNIYHVYPFEARDNNDDDDEAAAGEERTVAVDFWTRQGYSSLEHWLTESTIRWKASYSWNQKKRKRIAQDCEEIVHLTESTFPKWLRVRKNQWRVLRRKRQRQRQEHDMAEILASVAFKHEPLRHATNALPLQQHEEQKYDSSLTESVVGLPCPAPTGGHGVATGHFSGGFKATHPQKNSDSDIAVIDAFLEDCERQQREEAMKKHQSFDFSLLLNPSNGAPDDIVVHLMEYLKPQDQHALICLNRTYRRCLTQERSQVWRMLCPPRWTLPRRPRKPWHELYFANWKTEQEMAKKRLDDLLTKASQILFKGDHIHQIEKLITQAEREFSFDVNYSSGIVCERNSLLNLATIHKRHKVVRWLVEQKQADIESQDRGSFTPLLNAAWAGDKYLVRFFLQQGANRKHVGTCHYTRPLAPPDFPGQTAAEWAQYKGFKEIATLIELGL